MPTYCIPDLSSVPGSFGPFDWWSDPPDETKLRFSPDNPNWLGAFSLSRGDGANSLDQFRALKGKIGGGEFPSQYLFLSWVSRISKLDTHALDRLNVILGAGNNYVAFQVILLSASETVAGTQGGDEGVYAYRMCNCTVSGLSLIHI